MFKNTKKNGYGNTLATITIIYNKKRYKVTYVVEESQIGIRIKPSSIYEYIPICKTDMELQIAAKKILKEKGM